MVKGLGLDINDALYGMSYANLLLYGASLPTYRSDKKDKRGRKQEKINADDPSNNKRIQELINKMK